MSSKYKKILIAVAVVALLVVIGAAYMGWNYQSMAAYNAKLAEADRLLEDKDYYNAVLKYQEAIDDKPKEEEAYLKLAYAYQLSGHKDYALQTIENGLALIPESDRLAAMLEELSGGKSAKGVRFDDTLLNSISANSYYDFTKTNGIEKKTVMKDGSICVRVRGINADLIYSNTSEQPEAVSGTSPAADSLPAYVIFDDIMSIFGGGSGASYDELKALDPDSLETDSDPKFGSCVKFSKGPYTILVQSDKNGNITGESDNKVYIPTKIDRGDGTTVKGTVIDAVTGEGVPNASLTFRSSNGEKYEAVTDSKGNFEASAGPGSCSVDCRADGYISETKDVYVPSYSDAWKCELVMSPEVDGGMARIVLTWGSSPNDLDSHLIGNGVHVSFIDMNEGKASLDLDDRDGYGPETTTIYDLKGNYTFVVHDFDSTGQLANSGAEVTVYLPGKTPETISISGSGDSYTWVAFELNDGELNVINQIKDYDLGYRDW